MPVIARKLLPAMLLSLAAPACAPASPGEIEEGGPGVPRCGPALGVVAKVIDGDTIELESGERVRYLMVDTPETTHGKHDCYGAEASEYNAELVLGQEVALTYDVECTDRYGRLLAYVEAPDGEVNSLLVARGYACLLHIPPNGDERLGEFESMAAAAETQRVGLWRDCPGACD